LKKPTAEESQQQEKEKKRLRSEGGKNNQGGGGMLVTIATFWKMKTSTRLEAGKDGRDWKGLFSVNVGGGICKAPITREFRPKSGGINRERRCAGKRQKDAPGNSGELTPSVS